MKSTDTNGLKAKKQVQISDLKGPQGNGSISTPSSTSPNIRGNPQVCGLNHFWIYQGPLAHPVEHLTLKLNKPKIPTDSNS